MRFGCRLDDGDFVRGCAPEQPAAVEPGQTWMSVETGESYPVYSVAHDVISREDSPLVRLGSESYAILVSEPDLRARFVCTDPPDNVRAIQRERREDA